MLGTFKVLDLKDISVKNNNHEEYIFTMHVFSL